MSYAYDGTGRRVARTVNGQTWQYLYGDLIRPYRVTAMRDSAGNLTNYYYDEAGLLFAIEQGAALYYVACDQVGTPKVVTDSAGTVIKVLDYDSFGGLVSDLNPAFYLPIGFAGGLANDDTGLVRFGFRDYDPVVGRWTARDPIFFGGGQGNLFGYCGNDPINAKDPLGLDATISLYPGAGGFGHVGIGINTKSTVGRYPAEGSSGIDMFLGNDVSGEIRPDQRCAERTITLNSTSEQDKAMQDYIEQAMNDPGNYNLYELNCAHFVQEVLRAGGFNGPSTNRPRILMNHLEAGRFSSPQ